MDPCRMNRVALACHGSWRRTKIPLPYYAGTRREDRLFRVPRARDLVPGCFQARRGSSLSLSLSNQRVFSARSRLRVLSWFPSKARPQSGRSLTGRNVDFEGGWLTFAKRHIKVRFAPLYSHSGPKLLPCEPTVRLSCMPTLIALKTAVRRLTSRLFRMAKSSIHKAASSGALKFKQDKPAFLSQNFPNADC